MGVSRPNRGESLSQLLGHLIEVRSGCAQIALKEDAVESQRLAFSLVKRLEETLSKGLNFFEVGY